MPTKTNILAIIYFAFGSLGFSQNNQYIISSGSKGGNYHKASELISKCLSESFPGISFSNISSKGSLDNIANLQTNYADFAIVQRNILLNTLFDESHGIKNIEVIAPLFQEKLLIYHANNKNVNFKELIKLVDSGTIKTIGFTDRESYSFKLFSQVSKLLNFPLEKVTFQFENYNALIENLKLKKLDAIVSFSLEIEELEKTSDIYKVHFSFDDVTLLKHRITNINSLEFEENKHLISSFTFLIGLTNKATTIYNTTGKTLSQTLINALENNSTFVGEKIRNTIRFFKQQQQHIYLKGIPINNELSDIINYNQNKTLSKILYLFTLTIIGFLFFKLSKRYELTLKVFWYKYNHIFIGIFLLFVLYYCCVEVLIIGEKNLYESLKIKSQILNMQKKDLHLWVFVSNLVGETNGVFPLSTLGKLMFSVSFYSVGIGGICIFFVNQFKSYYRKKRKLGMEKITFKNHLIISGWNNSTHKFIEDFIYNIKHYTTKKQRIVCVVENIKEVYAKHHSIVKLHEVFEIEIIEGDVRQEQTLQQINIKHAKAVVLFSEDATDKSDEKTLLRAFAISRFCKVRNQGKASKNIASVSYDLHTTNEYKDAIYIIAEINNEVFRQDLISADVNEVICTSNYSKNIISQALINRGLSKVLEQILSFNKDNEFYSISLEDKPNKIFVGKTFDELLIMLRKVQMQLIGIRVVFHDENNHEIIERKEIERLLKEKENLTRDIIINPKNEVELHRKTDDDDVLIVFAESEKEINTNIKKLIRLHKNLKI